MNRLNLKRLVVNQWMRNILSSPFHTKVRSSCIFESLRQHHHIAPSLGYNIFRNHSALFNSHPVVSNSFPVLRSFLSSLQLHQFHTTSQYNMPPFVSRRVSIQWLPPGTQPMPPSEPTSTLVLSDASMPGGTGRFVDIRIHQCALTKPSDNTLSPADIDWAIAGVCTSTPLNPEDQKNAEVVYTRKASFLHEIDSRAVLDNSGDYTDEGYMRPAADGTGDELEHATIFNPAEGVLMACEERWSDPDVNSLPGRKHRECIIMRIQQSIEATHKGQLLLLGSNMQAIVASSSGEMYLQRWEYKIDDAHDIRKTFNDLGTWKLIASLGSQDIIPSPDHVLEGEDLKVKNLVWEVFKKIEW